MISTTSAKSDALAELRRNERAEPASHDYPSRLRFWQLLEQAQPDDQLSRIVDLALMTLIILTAVAITLESMESMRIRYFAVFSTAISHKLPLAGKCSARQLPLWA